MSDRKGDRNRVSLFHASWDLVRELSRPRPLHRCSRAQSGFLSAVWLVSWMNLLVRIPTFGRDRGVMTLAGVPRAVWSFGSWASAIRRREPINTLQSLGSVFVVFVGNSGRGLNLRAGNGVQMLTKSYTV